MEHHPWENLNCLHSLQIYIRILKSIECCLHVQEHSKTWNKYYHFRKAWQKHNWKISCITAFLLPDNPIAREATIQHRLILSSGQTDTRSSPPELLYFLNVGNQLHTLQRRDAHYSLQPGHRHTHTRDNWGHICSLQGHTRTLVPHRGEGETRGQHQPHYDSLPLVSTSLLRVCCWWGDEIVGVYM